MKKFVSGVCMFAIFLFSVNTYAQELKPTTTKALLIVTVNNFKKVPQAGEKVSFVSSKTKKVYSGVTDDKGSFKLLLPKGDEYKVRYKSFTDNKDYQPIKIPDSPNQLLTLNFNIQIELPHTYTLKNVFFASGKATLRPASYKALNNLVEFMKLKKSLVIEIAGYTDNVGKPDANLKLSQQRAETVRDYLIKKGISAKRVTAKGYGENNPVASNDTEKGRQQNRRTEVHIIKE